MQEIVDEMSTFELSPEHQHVPGEEMDESEKKKCDTIEDRMNRLYGDKSMDFVLSEFSLGSLDAEYLKSSREAIKHAEYILEQSKPLRPPKRRMYSGKVENSASKDPWDHKWGLI